MKIKEYSRVIKCKLLPTPQEHQELYNSYIAYKKAVNEFNRFIIQYIPKYTYSVRNGKYSKLISIPYLLRDIIYGQNPSSLIKTPIKPKDREKIQRRFFFILKKHGIDLDTQRAGQDIALCSTRLYNSVQKRHKKLPIMAPYIKSNKEIRTDNCNFKIVKQNGEWYFAYQVLQGIGHKIKLKAYGSDTETKLKTLAEKSKKQGCGGTLYYHKKIGFIASIRVKVKKQDIYKPKMYLGIDINKRNDVYISCSDGTIIPKPPSLIASLDELKQTNTDIRKSKCSNNTIKLKQHRDNLIQKVKNETRKIAAELLKKTINNQAVLCIDWAKPGGGCGEYGQIIGDVLRDACERGQIPHEIVPSQYTSTTCIKCNHMNKNNRVDETTFLCQKCGHKEDADIHAAKYIAKVGEIMYNN